MTSLNNDSDVKPWYKQFWPWFIMALPASAVIAGITTVFIAYENADSLVVDDYYKEGKAINMRTARIKEAEKRGYSANLERLKGNFVNLTFTSSKPVDPELTLKWVHPTQSERDFEMTLSRQADGSYQGLAAAATEGRWYLQLSAAEEWLLKTEISTSSVSATFNPK